MKNIITFKTDKQQNEWHNKNLDNRLKFLVEALALISWGFFEKRLVITEIFRTQEENDKIYREPGHISVHQLWRGIDIRTKDYTSKQVQTLVDIANQIVYDENRPHMQTAVYGDERHQDHIHLQVKF